MLGIVIALVWFAYVAFGQNAPMGGYHESTNFLFWWYAIWQGLVLGLMVIITILGMLGVGAAVASNGRSNVGRLLGFAGGAMVGGTIGGLGVVLTGVYTALFCGGAWLLCHAADGASDLGHLNTTKLVVGGIMLLIGVLASRKSSSSRNSDD